MTFGTVCGRLPIELPRDITLCDANLKVLATSYFSTILSRCRSCRSAGTVVRFLGPCVCDGPERPSSVSVISPCHVSSLSSRLCFRWRLLAVGLPPAIGQPGQWSRSPLLMLAEPAGYGHDWTVQTLPARRSHSSPSLFSSSLPCWSFCLTCPRWLPHPLRLPPNPTPNPRLPRLQRPQLNRCRSLESSWMGWGGRVHQYGLWERSTHSYEGIREYHFVRGYIKIWRGVSI